MGKVFYLKSRARTNENLPSEAYWSGIPSCGKPKLLAGEGNGSASRRVAVNFGELQFAQLPLFVRLLWECTRKYRMEAGASEDVGLWAVAGRCRLTQAGFTPSEHSMQWLLTRTPVPNDDDAC